MAQRQIRDNDTDKWLDGLGHSAQNIVIDENTVLANEYVAFGGTVGTKPSISSFNNGDILIVHQTRGLSADTDPTWEVNMKKAGALKYNLTRTFVNNTGISDADRAQIIKAVVCNKFSLTNGATLTIPAWDQYKQGIGVIFADEVDLSGGTVDLRNAGFMAGLTGGDYAGGRGEGWPDHALSPYGNYPQAGDPSAGDRAIGRPANGNTGGRGSGTNSNDEYQPGAGGAGNKNAGNNGSQGTSTAYSGSGGDYGLAGAAAGNDSLSKLVFGGAGSVGAGTTHNGWHPSLSAGRGTGNLIIFCRKFKAPYRVIVDGSNAAAYNDDRQGGSSGSAGGNFLLNCIEGELGTDVITALAGTGVLRAGSSSIGRIAVRYAKSITGETNPDAVTVQDKTLLRFPKAVGALASLV